MLPALRALAAAGLCAALAGSSACSTSSSSWREAGACHSIAWDVSTFEGSITGVITEVSELAGTVQVAMERETTSPMLFVLSGDRFVSGIQVTSASGSRVEGRLVMVQMRARVGDLVWNGVGPSP